MAVCWTKALLLCIKTLGRTLTSRQYAHWREIKIHPKVPRAYAVDLSDTNMSCESPRALNDLLYVC